MSFELILDLPKSCKIAFISTEESPQIKQCLQKVKLWVVLGLSQLKTLVNPWTLEMFIHNNYRVGQPSVNNNWGAKIIWLCMPRRSSIIQVNMIFGKHFFFLNFKKFTLFSNSRFYLISLSWENYTLKIDMLAASQKKKKIKVSYSLTPASWYMGYSKDRRPFPLHGSSCFCGGLVWKIVSFCGHLRQRAQTQADARILTIARQRSCTWQM